LSNSSIMGTATSVVECANRYPYLPEVNCTKSSVEFGQFTSNPAVTGIGVRPCHIKPLFQCLTNNCTPKQTDISFVLTAGLSLFVCSCVQIICDRFRHHQWRRFFEPLVISFSDQQIVRGLSLSVATLYTSAACTLDAYRYDMICYLILMTIVSHLSAVLVLRSYTSGYKILALLRFGLVGCQIVFAGLVFSSRLTPSFPTGIPSADNAKNTTLVLPAVCFALVDAKSYSGLEDIPKDNHKDIAGFASYIIMAVFYFISIIFTFAHIFTFYFMHGSSKEVRDMEDRAAKWTWFWWLGLIRGAILLAAWIIWGWAVAQLYLFRGWMNSSGWMGQQDRLAEDGWTFGQLLSVFLLAAAPLSVMNAWNGECPRV
jgi:hypothetical protein